MRVARIRDWIPPPPNPRTNPIGFKRWVNSNKKQREDDERQERLSKLKWKRRFFLISKAKYEAEVFSEHL